MNPRCLPVRPALALIVSLAGAAGHTEPAGQAAAASSPAIASAPATANATPVAPPAGTADQTAVDDAQAPPAPPLSPAQAYRPLNFYTREELRSFPPASVPKIAPFCHGAYVAPPLPPLDGGNGVNPPVYVAADRMQLDENGESRVAGGVEVRQGQNMMRADSAVISSGRSKVQLDGNVYLQDPAMTVEASHAELTLDGTSSHINNTRYALNAQHIRGSATAIDRKGMYRAQIVGGAYTTCEPGHAAWMIAAHRINLDEEAGWGSATHMRLLVDNLPVLYVPYITFPIDKRRQSGVLYPTFNFSSKAGTDISLPYYLNLDPQYDLLVTPRWIERRGTLTESEFRYVQGTPGESFGDGSLGGAWIAHDALYNDNDRYILRLHHNGEPADGWQVYADATRVSDNEYLDDLATQLSVNRDAHLLRIAQARYAADDWDALVRVQGYQTIDSTIAMNNLPYRRLPQLLATTAQPLGLGAQWGAIGEYVYFERNLSIADPAGSRARLEPELSWPLNGSSYRLVPTVKVRNADYQLVDNGADNSLERTVPTASLDGTLFLERPFRLLDNDWTQTLEPRAYALWTPYVDQSAMPLFDTTAFTFGYDQLFRDNRFVGGDRVGDAQQLSLAVESRFIGPDGNEAARLGFGQTVYGADRRVQALPTDPVDTTRLSPYVASAQWRVSTHWNARAEGQWAPETRDFVRGNLRANWQDAQFRTLNVAYRYDVTGIEQAELSGLVPVEPNWNFVGRWVFDFPTARSLEALGGFEYESCCWRARVIARHVLDIHTSSATLAPTNSVVFEIELKGLGSLGEKISSELAETIPGYENRRKSLTTP